MPKTQTIVATKLTKIFICYFNSEITKKSIEKALEFADPRAKQHPVVAARLELVQ